MLKCMRLSVRKHFGPLHLQMMQVLGVSEGDLVQITHVRLPSATFSQFQLMAADRKHPAFTKADNDVAAAKTLYVFVWVYVFVGCGFWVCFVCLCLCVCVFVCLCFVLFCVLCWCIRCAFVRGCVCKCFVLSFRFCSFVLCSLFVSSLLISMNSVCLLIGVCVRRRSFKMA